ncbi:UNKNOWN [Stylonychia lemnae]|uniref:Uncharacterized protein n=1 Tax=Stylonychia lemnae TaxID=5949 RepID=A0A078AXH7_STYLE|nr:UNKNOWN [Stylonychia lemnae]|eukprot:CDW86776.1 UNKNOWN [Stylonychia lemnae]
MKTNRAAGIGYGSRDIFKNRVDSPSPTNYEAKSIFSKTASSKAFSFGIAREAYSKVYIKENPLADQCVPGPGQYSIPPIVGKEAVHYTMRPKTQNLQQSLLYKGQPGPGQYEPKPALNDKGYYFNSKFKNSSATSIDPPSSLRFKEFTSIKANPGPGAYEPHVNMTQTGSYFVSKFMSSMCRTHYHADRQTLGSFANLKTPGPGNYRAPSDFGYYEAKKKFQMSASTPNLGSMLRSASQPGLHNDKKNEL